MWGDQIGHSQAPTFLRKQSRTVSLKLIEHNPFASPTHHSIQSENCHFKEEKTTFQRLLMSSFLALSACKHVSTSQVWAARCLDKSTFPWRIPISHIRRDSRYGSSRPIFVLPLGHTQFLLFKGRNLPACSKGKGKSVVKYKILNMFNWVWLHFWFCH